jgi:hypothetical protein
LANYSKERGKRKKIQINKIRDVKGDITINTNDIQKIIREYYEKIKIGKSRRNG